MWRRDSFPSNLQFLRAMHSPYRCSRSSRVNYHSERRVNWCYKVFHSGANYIVKRSACFSLCEDRGAVYVRSLFSLTLLRQVRYKDRKDFETVCGTRIIVGEKFLVIAMRHLSLVAQD